MKIIKKWLFTVLYFGISLLPLVLLPVVGTGKSEKEETEISKDNITGEYFENHFALREELATCNSLIKTKLFHDSSGEDVIAGPEGWLFYRNTLSDFIGEKTLSDRQLRKIAHNLSLIEETLKQDGIGFAFTVAPNKNSLYPQYMPKGYEINDENKNVLRLQKLLNPDSYVDLFELFQGQRDCLYHKTDSHWNNKGAQLVNQKLMSALARDSVVYQEPVKRNDFTGDLYSMLYPVLSGREEEFYYDEQFDYKYKKPIFSNYDNEIETVNDKKGESVLVCRDSFGNSLLPFVANEFGSAFFTREIPYPLYLATEQKLDFVIIELVERHLHYLQEYAPVLPVKEVDLSLPAMQSDERELELHTELTEEFIRVSGELGEQEADDIYIVLQREKDTRIYPVYMLTSDNEKLSTESFEVYLENQLTEEYRVSVLLQINGRWMWEKPSSDIIVGSKVERGRETANKEYLNSEQMKDRARELIGEDVGKLIDEIGAPDKQTLSPSCATEGEDGVYEWEDFTVYTQSQKVGGPQIIVNVK